MNGFVRQGNRPDGFEMVRSGMIDRLRGHYQISDERVLEAMGSLPRHRFVPEALKAQSYKDNALPISSGQTISQPFIVAKMTELLELTGNERVLEIGAGTGYQTALLAMLAGKVFAIERLPKLAKEAETRLLAMGFTNVILKADDGTIGWDVYHPFDAILVAAGGPNVPETLLEQLRIGGKLVIPVGEDHQKQRLVRVVHTASGVVTEDHGQCAFVPLIGKFGWELPAE